VPERARHTRRGPRPAWLSTPVLGLADRLSALSHPVGSDFEAVDVSALRISADSGAAR